ncbi:MAG: NotI family restriction endonuclease [Gammaproteobacteria bacterium]|nr:NotI family restriction endonuclease [Gammaproteobacteria bacterium]
MPFDPEEYLGEILGQPATKGFDPGARDYLCPFIDARCTKRSTSLGRVPYPVCSIRRNIRGKPSRVCVCPKRFYSVDFLTDVVDHCWPGEPPANPEIAPEVKMTGFGNVDFVIADIGQEGAIREFLSVELQAIDITGSVMPAYEALRADMVMEARPTYGLNWSNVYKRYITQLIRKGYFHHHWGTKIVAVMQDVVYDYICNWAEFMRSDDVKGSTVNIIFMAYRYEDDPNSSGAPKLVLDTIEGTSHANLQQAVLYKEAPSRDAFCQQIKRALHRSNDLIQSFEQ